MRGEVACLPSTSRRRGSKALEERAGVMREPVALLGGRSLINQKHGTPSRFPRGGSVVTQFEKMTAWRRSIPQQKKLGLPVPPHMPVTHDASKALWRGLEPILCVGNDGDFRPGIIRWLEEIRTEVLDSEEHVLNMVAIHAQGMTYGTQSSVFETGIDDKLSLNMVMFRHDYAGIAAVVDVVKSMDKAVTALTMFVRNLRSAAGGHSGKTQEMADQIRESAYADLDLLFRDRLANFDESQDPVTYSNAWLDEVHRLLLTMGRDYLSQSPVPVFEEHESGRFLKRTCNQG